MSIKRSFSGVICSILVALMMFGCGTPKNQEPVAAKPGTEANNPGTVGVNEIKPPETGKAGENKQNTEVTNAKPSAAVPVPAVKVVVSYKKGDRGEAVKDFQRKLNKFNYRIGVDGIFGSRTLWAVKDFQKKNKLPVDGIVGETTLQKLSLKPTRETTYVAPPSQPKPKDVPASAASLADIEAFANSNGFASDTKYMMWVNTKTCHTYIFTGEKGSWKLYKDMLCTVGKASTPTKKGTFKLGGRGTSFRAGSNTICRYWTRIYGGYLFHTVLLDNKGNIQDGRLGMKLSHGCVRLSIENALFVYNNMPSGTTVFIN